MDKLWINPVVAGTVSMIGMAMSPMRSLRAGIAATQDRRQRDLALQAHERALSSWSFDEDKDIWIPEALRS